MMIRFTTDDIAPKDRFDHWRETRAKNLFGVTIEMPAERRSRFFGAFSAHTVGNAVASEMRASAYHVSRRPADIARAAANSLCIGFQVHGPGMFDTGHGRSHFVGNGDMVINFSDLPFYATPGTQDDFHFQLLKIPVEDSLMLGQPVDDLFAARFVGDAACSRAFRALFRALMSERGLVGDAHADVAHIARLALLARGRLKEGMPEVRAALRAGQRYAAREIMFRRKHEQKLTPAMVAAELGMSARQLFIVFESAEQSYLQTLTSLRLAEAQRLLACADRLPIAQIVYASGFDSVATFYRHFKRLCGMAPGEFREHNHLLRQTHWERPAF
ncbi:helix-turn-helix transcriptional regulator [Pandoraea anhela]|uniref:AraC family transcriptional regulator n=1 Tax=Pandoraea anhela TaxID=2508295 RepID=A0A5E4WF23_9BURK|nr:AraC family transcriptional regulator [Pandoraea anhela]VVE22174.1 AraC family transcriptional regulator [Pandoraea anhela]